MQRHEWFKPLMDKLLDSYSARIIVIDNCRYSMRPEFTVALKKHFAVHFYKSELELRSFLRQNRGFRTLIIKLPQVSYFPFDIEQSSQLICWGEEDVVSSPADRGEVEPKERICSEIYTIAAEIERLLGEGKGAWGKLGYLWGKLSFLQDGLFYSTIYNNNISLPVVERIFRDLDTKLEEEFTYFMLNHYKTLFYQSIYFEPVTIDRVLPFCRHQGFEKLALICMDGMGFQEWFCVKNYLGDRGISKFRETHVFALLPTVTEISRRALFSGKRHLADLPMDARGFREYVDRNMPVSQGQAQYFFDKYPRLRMEYFTSDYVGIVFGLVDDLLHRTRSIGQGKVLLQHNLELLLRQTELNKIVEGFLARGFKVIITADHGSVYSRGMGVKQEKYLLSKRARRACLFPNKHLAMEFSGKDERLIFYENKELLGESCAVFAPWRGMFGSLKESGISHGGLHLEEVIVPFVEVLT